MFKRLIILSFILLPLASVFADTPGELLEKNTRELLETLSSEGNDLLEDKVRLGALVDEKVLPVIDFEAMSKLTLGQALEKSIKRTANPVCKCLPGIARENLYKITNGFCW